MSAARREAQRALAISPTDTSGLLIAGILSRTLGRWNDAERQLRAVLVRNPLDSTAVFHLGLTYYHAGRFEDSERVYRQLLELEESYAWAREYLAKTVLALGRPEEALTIVQRDADDESRLMGLPIVLQAAGRGAEADLALKAAIDHWADRSAYSVAMTYAYRGEDDLAFEWLERAYKQKDVGLPEIVGEHPVQEYGWRSSLHGISAQDEFAQLRRDADRRFPRKSLLIPPDNRSFGINRRQRTILL